MARSGFAGVQGGDTEQVVELRIAGAVGLLREQQLVGLLVLAVAEELFRAVGQGIGERACSGDGKRRREDCLSELHPDPPSISCFRRGESKPDEAIGL